MTAGRPLDYDPARLPVTCEHSPDFEPAWCYQCVSLARGRRSLPETSDDAPVVDAVFEGECRGCSMTIYPGQRIRKVDGTWVHEGC